MKLIEKLKIMEVVSQEGWDYSELVVDIGLKLNEIIEEINKHGTSEVTGTNLEQK